MFGKDCPSWWTDDLWESSWLECFIPSYKGMKGKWRKRVSLSWCSKRDSSWSPDLYFQINRFDCWSFAMESSSYVVWAGLSWVWWICTGIQISFPANVKCLIAFFWTNFRSMHCWQIGSWSIGACFHLDVKIWLEQGQSNNWLTQFIPRCTDSFRWRGSPIGEARFQGAILHLNKFHRLQCLTRRITECTLYCKLLYGSLREAINRIYARDCI